MENMLPEEYEDMKEHEHWSAYDMKLEGGFFNWLDDSLKNDRKNTFKLHDIMNELINMASSFGYGSADSHLSSIDNVEDEDLKSIYISDYEDLESESEYANNLSKSISILTAKYSDEETKEMLLTLSDKMIDAISNGKLSREKMQNVKLFKQ